MPINWRKVSFQITHSREILKIKQWIFSGIDFDTAKLRIKTRPSKSIEHQHIAKACIFQNNFIRDYQARRQTCHETTFLHFVAIQTSLSTWGNLMKKACLSFVVRQAFVLIDN